jgi:hypothetical protein
MAEEDRLGQRDWGGDTAALGGYGSAGLYSRRRQMERTTGGSFLNISDAPNTGGVGGGYVRMPSVGPKPKETTPLVSSPTGPAGPSGMAPGVAPDFTGRIPDTPNWGQTSAVLGRAAGAAIVAGARRAMSREKKPEPEVPPYSSRIGGRYGQGPQAPKAIGQGRKAIGQSRKAIGQGEVLEGEIVDPDEYIGIGGRKALEQGVIDAESWEVAGELRDGQPIGELEASRFRALGRGAFPMGSAPRPTSTPSNVFSPPATFEPGVQGGVVSQTRPESTPAVVSQRASRVRSRPTVVRMQGEGGSIPATAMGEVVSAQVQERRQQQKQQQAVEEKSNEYEYGNAYYGQSAGRSATRGERNARKTAQQGQIPGFGWGNV